MELWGWVAGYVALFVLLQALLYYRYVYRGNGPTTSIPDGSTARRGSPSSERSAPNGDGEGNPDPDVSGETIRCPHCGGRNETDPAFTYCRHCVSPLRR